jgi:hypothetical protein
MDNLKAVADAKPPSSILEVRKFLGLCSFFKVNIWNSNQIKAPLNALKLKDCPWKTRKMMLETVKSLQELRTILTSKPLVHYPQQELSYILITDACQGDAEKPGCYRAILAQVTTDGEFQVFSYALKKLKSHEKNNAPFLLETSASV